MRSLRLVVLKQRSKQEIRRGEQGFILSFPPDVGIIFTCKIATFRAIFEPSSQLPERFPHFDIQK